MRFFGLLLFCFLVLTCVIIVEVFHERAQARTSYCHEQAAALFVPCDLVSNASK